MALHCGSARVGRDRRTRRFCSHCDPTRPQAILPFGSSRPSKPLRSQGHERRLTIGHRHQAPQECSQSWYDVHLRFHGREVQPSQPARQRVGSRNDRSAPLSTSTCRRRGRLSKIASGLAIKPTRHSRCSRQKMIRRSSAVPTMMRADLDSVVLLGLRIEASDAPTIRKLVF